MDTTQPGPLAQPLELIGVPLMPYRCRVLVHRYQPVIRPNDAQRQRLGLLARLECAQRLSQLRRRWEVPTAAPGLR